MSDNIDAAEISRLIEDELNNKDESSPASTLAFDEFAGDTIIGWKYLRRLRKKWRLRQKFGSAEELAQHFDPVEPNLIAKFNVERAYEGAPTFAKEFIQYTLPDDSDLIKNNNLKEKIKLTVNDVDTIEGMMKRKGVPRFAKVEKMVATAVSRTLVGHNNLFRQEPHLEAEQDAWKKAQEKLRNNNMPVDPYQAFMCC